MGIDRTTAAMVSAYFTSWVDPEAFAISAAENQIYQQRHHPSSDTVWSCYVLVASDAEHPQKQLVDVVYANNLSLVIPCNDVSGKTLKIAQDIEASRQYYPDSSFEITLVGEIGADAATGEARYVCLYFQTTNELYKRLQAEVGQDDISSCSSDLITEAMDRIVKSNPKMARTSVTLTQIKKRGA